MVFLAAFAALLALLFLPGWVTLLAFSPTASRPLVAKPWERWFQALLFGVTFNGWVGVLLVHLGWFSLTSLFLINVLYTVGIGYWAWRRGNLGPLSLPQFERESWWIVGLVLLAVLLFFHPHEFLLGGADAGVYVNLGRNIAQTGRWLVDDPLMVDAASALYPALFRQQPEHMATRYIQFPGFYLPEPSKGLVIPQFYPLHPIWMAIFYSLGGLRFSLLTTPLWGLLGVLSVYFTATHLFNQRTGRLAALFLTITATQVWFSRYPTAETLTQFLFFGGVYAFSRFVDEPRPWFGLLAGLALGQTMLVRIDMYFLVGIPLTYFLLLWLGRRLRRVHWSFFIPFGLQTVHSLAWAYSRSWPYFLDVYGVVLMTFPPLPWLAGLGAVTLVVFWALSRRVAANDRLLTQVLSYRDLAAKVLGGFIVVAALYAYFLRPVVANTQLSWLYWYSRGEVPYVEPYNMMRLGWYLSPLGLALTLTGIWLWLRNALDRRTLLLLGTGLFFSFMFIQNSRNNPHHIYVMRRYVPVVIPFFAVAAAYALAFWMQKGRRWRAMALSLTFALSGWLLYNSRVVIPHVEYRGLLSQFDALVEQLGEAEGTLILFDDDLPVSSGARVGTPLRYLYDYAVFDVQEELVDPELLEEQVAQWQLDGWRVLLVEGSNARGDLLDDLSKEFVAGFEFDFAVLEVSYEHFPVQIWQNTLPLQIYRLDANGGG